MTNEEEVERIKNMDIKELFAYVLEDSTILTDSYYRIFGTAVRDRADELGVTYDS